MKYIIAAIVVWISLSVVTYSSCIGRYDLKFPEWRGVEAATRVPRTCIIQAVFPLSGLPLVLATNDWHWKLSW